MGGGKGGQAQAQRHKKQKQEQKINKTNRAQPPCRQGQPANEENTFSDKKSITVAVDSLNPDF